MSARISKFAPQTAEAVDVIDRALAPALRAMKQAMNQRDGAATNRSADQARAAEGTCSG